MLSSYISIKAKNPALSADLYALFFTLKCNLLTPLTVNSYVFEDVSIFSRVSTFHSLCKTSVRGKAH